MNAPAAEPGDVIEDGSDDRQTTAARRVLLLAVAALAMALGAAIVLVAGGSDAADDLAAATDQSVPVAAIGPGPGRDVGGYVDSRRAALTEIDGAAMAVVSFTAYVPADEVDDLVGDDVAVKALLVALPGSMPATTTDPAAYRRSTVADAEAQSAEITGLLPSVDDVEFADFYRSELDRYGLVAAAADRADIVFAVVVQASGPQLRALAIRPGVRIVDAGPGTTLAPEASVTGLRPEETTTTGSPEFRPS